MQDQQGIRSNSSRPYFLVRLALGLSTVISASSWIATPSKLEENKGILMKYLIRITLSIFLLAPHPVFAVETVKSPLIYEGDVQLEQLGKYQHDSSAKRDDEKEYDLGVAYGVTDRWRTKLQTEFEEKRSANLHYKNINWENIVSLTGNNSTLPTTLYLDVLAADRPDSSHSALMGIIMLKELGPTVNMVNLFLRREFGDTASDKTSFVYRFQSRYHLYSYLDPGFELWG